MPHPELIHRVKGAFGADTGISGKLYNDLNFQWRKLDVVHLMMRHRNYSKDSKAFVSIKILFSHFVII